MTDVAVVIPTAGRPASLSDTLAAVERAVAATALNVEVLVVHNGTTTPPTGLYGRHLARLQPNASAARNMGVAFTAAPIILFADDDVRPPVDWIDRMTEPIRSGAADAVAGGVHMAPHLERPWMTPTTRAMLVDTREALDPERPTLIGANMAVSRAAFVAVGGFREELGPGALGGNEDGLLSLTLAAAKYRIVAAADVAVEHHFDPSRLNRAGMIARVVKQGRSEAWIMQNWMHSRPRLLPVRLIRSCAATAWRAIARRRPVDDRELAWRLRLAREWALLTTAPEHPWKVALGQLSP